MKKMLLATVAAFTFASGANALTLIRADVTGPTGTVWTTNPSGTGYYTLFLQSPGLGDFINPNSEQISFPISDSGITRALLAGEGFTPGTDGDSDPFYNLTLGFDSGQTLTGVYTPTTNPSSAAAPSPTAARSTRSSSSLIVVSSATQYRQTSRRRAATGMTTSATSGSARLPLLFLSQRLGR